MTTTQIDGARQVKDATITNTQISASAAIALSKLAEPVIQADGGQAFTADQSLGGFKLTSVATPVSGTDAANKDYVDGLAQGIAWKDSVRAASTATLTLSGTQTVDGVALSAGDRILVKNQTLGQNNGIYVVAAGAWARATDADTAGELLEAAVFVEEGTANQDTLWVNTTNAGFVLGTDPLTFVQLSSGTMPTAGAGLTLTGSTLDVIVGDGLVTGADVVNLALDGSTLSKSGTGLKVASAGITGTELNTSVAGSGLAGGGGSALSVNVDGSTLEINTDTLRVKDAGITGAKLGADARRVVRETPTGSVNGSNVTFTLANTPTAGSEEVFLNGILQEPGAGNDYTVSGAVLTYLSAPLTGDRLRVSYLH